MSPDMELFISKTTCRISRKDVTAVKKVTGGGS
jgi:hypothetical protein